MDTMSRFLLDLYRGAWELPVPKFQERAFTLLKPLLRFDSGIWGVGEVTEEAGLVIQTLHLHEQPEGWITSYEHFNSHDFAAFLVDTRAGEVCNFHFPDIDTGRLNAVNRHHCKKFETQNALITFSPAHEISSQDFMALFRAKSRDQYSEEEHRLANILLPHLIEAGRINRLLWLNKMTSEVLARRGARGIASVDGVLHTNDKDLVGLVRREWPEWMPPILPQQLLTTLRASSSGHYAGKRIVAGVSLIEDMLFLRIRHRSPVDALTPAEGSVANLIAHGQSYKEVARKLGVSVATVRNQLHGVYQKLDINNKAALAQCLNEDI